MFAPCARETHPIRAGQRLPVDPHGAERGVRGQALVPLAGPLLGHGLHEVPLQLADAGVVLEDVLVGLVQVLRGGGDGGWGLRREVGVGKFADKDSGGKYRQRMYEGHDCVRGGKEKKRKRKSQIVCFLISCCRGI